MTDFLLYAGLIAAGYLLHMLVGVLKRRSRNAPPQYTAADASELLQRAAQQDSFFNMVLGHIPCQVFIKDPLDGFRYKLANKNFIEYYQLRTEDVLQHPDEDIFDPEVTRQLRAHDREVCATPGKVFRYDEDVSFRRRGKEVFKSLKVCFNTPDHHPYMLGVCVDITDMNKLIQMEQISNEVLSQAVAESNFRKVVEVSTQTLRKELNCSRVIFLSSAAAGQMKLFHEEYAPGLSPVSTDRLTEHEGLWNAHWDRLNCNELIVYDDFRTIPGIEDFIRTHPDYPTRAIAGVPVFVGEKLSGALLISYCVPHVFRETDRTLLRAMSKIVTLAAIRDRQTIAMRRAEEENQALLDNISIPLWLFDTQGRIVKTNLAAEKILGRASRHVSYDCRRLLGCAIPEADCPVRRALNTHETGRRHCQYHGKTYLVETSPIMDGTKAAVRGAVSSFYDVSELQDAISCRQSVNDCLINLVRESDTSTAIQKSIQDICAHLKATRCYIMRFNIETQTVSCFLEYTRSGDSALSQIQNKKYSVETDWLGCFMKNPLLAFPTPESLANHQGVASYRNDFSQYDVQSVYAHRILLNGKIWGYVSALYEGAPHELTASENDYIGSIAYCIELMLIRRQYQDGIFNALRKAEDADKAKSMFLASMSHEIRTPLNAVIGFSELLKGGGLPPETEHDYLSAISDAGNALLALINDVLDLSKLEAGQMVFSPTAADFAELVNGVGKIFQQKCHEKGLSFQTDIPDDLPLLQLDELRTRQILFNLVGNAVKFTEHGTISVHAEFEPGSARQGTLTFSVADTGIGISPQDQPHLFEMFVQGKALRGTRTERNGTGLGLAICKRMIEKMDGKIFLESESGRGSKFTVVLNAVPWKKRDPLPAGASSASAGSAAAHGPLTVLVADDVAMNLKVLAAMLHRVDSNITVLTAKNADEALLILDKHSVHFLLTDLWMPGMNGAELATRIRRSGQYPHLVVAAVTADMGGCENFDMSAFDAVLCKPVTLEKLNRFLFGEPAAHP